MSKIETPYRIVVCIDVYANDLEQAYEKVFESMNAACATPPVGRPSGDMEWESSDEAFDPDGHEIDPDELSAARAAVFDRIFSRNND